MHAAYTNNPAANSMPYSPTFELLEPNTNSKHYILEIEEHDTIFDTFHKSRRELIVKPYCETIDVGNFYVILFNFL